MNRLFCDTETTGLPKFGADNPADGEGQPRMCQIAMVMLNPALEVMHRYEGIIKPDGWIVPPDALAIHGLTTEICAERGVTVADALAVFETFHAVAEELIFFGPFFDQKIIRGEIRRNDPAADDHYGQRPVVDVMRALLGHTKMPKAKGAGFKLPKLGEATKIILQREHVRAHDAMADVEATIDLWRWLDARGERPVGQMPKMREAAA